MLTRFSMAYLGEYGGERWIDPSKCTRPEKGGRRGDSLNHDEGTAQKQNKNKSERRIKLILPMKHRRLHFVALNTNQMSAHVRGNKSLSHGIPSVRERSIMSGARASSLSSSPGKGKDLLCRGRLEPSTPRPRPHTLTPRCSNARN